MSWGSSYERHVLVQFSCHHLASAFSHLPVTHKRRKVWQASHGFCLAAWTCIVPFGWPHRRYDLNSTVQKTAKTMWSVETICLTQSHPWAIQLENAFERPCPVDSGEQDKADESRGAQPWSDFLNMQCPSSVHSTCLLHSRIHYIQAIEQVCLEPIVSFYKVRKRNICLKCLRGIFLLHSL